MSEGLVDEGNAHILHSSNGGITTFADDESDRNVATLNSLVLQSEGSVVTMRALDHENLHRQEVTGAVHSQALNGGERV
jgi:hypothetical protein